MISRTRRISCMRRCLNMAISNYADGEIDFQQLRESRTNNNNELLESPRTNKTLHPHSHVFVSGRITTFIIYSCEPPIIGLIIKIISFLLIATVLIDAETNYYFILLLKKNQKFMIRSWDFYWFLLFKHTIVCKITLFFF